MTTTRFVALLLAGWTATVGPASAGELFTPMLTSSNGGNGQSLVCRVINVGKKPQSITTELIGADGAVVDSQTCTVGPGSEGCVTSTPCAAPGFVCRAYCRFEAPSVRRIRGSIVLTPASTGDAVAALPAQ